MIRDARFGPMSRIPVIMMTAYPTRENILRARDLGASEVITKPITTASLGAALSRALPDGWDVSGDASTGTSGRRSP